MNDCQATTMKDIAEKFGVSVFYRFPRPQRKYEGEEG